MILKNRINAFVNLGYEIDRLLKQKSDDLYDRAAAENNWFNKQNIITALTGIRKFLDEDILEKWTKIYQLENKLLKRVGVISAGNIPMVGFHDLLSVLISGHNIMLKMSSQDGVLMRHFVEVLCKIEPEFRNKIELVDRLNDADAFIGTGSDNSARYFKYYFGQKQNIIRKNRTSIAVLTGNESSEDFKNLGKDIFTYFGLGCRNVSKVLVPEDYDFGDFFSSIQEFESQIEHHKYRNNYDYNKSIYLVNKEAHLDNGFLLLRKSTDLVSPISVLYFQEYKNEKEVESIIDESRDKIQCIVGQNFIPFGKAQEPEVWDYADDVDTLDFLSKL